MLLKLSLVVALLASAACGGSKSRSDSKHADSDTPLDSGEADASADTSLRDAGASAADASLTTGGAHTRLDAGSADAGRAEPKDAGAAMAKDAGAAKPSGPSMSAVSASGCPRETVACNSVCLPAGMKAGGCEALRVEEQVSALALAGDKLYVSQSRGIFELDLSSASFSYRQIAEDKLGTSHALAIAGRSLILTENFGPMRQVLRYDLDTDQLNILVDKLDAAPENVFVSGDFVYFVANTLFRVPVMGGTMQQLTAAAYRVRGYKAEADALFTLTDALRQHALSDVEGSAMVLQMSLPGEQLFADATYLYTKDANMLRRVPRLGGAAEALPEPRINGVAFASDGDDVYFTVGKDEGVVTRVRLGEKPESSVVYEGSWPMAAAVGGGYLYLGLYPSARGSGLVRVALP